MRDRRSGSAHPVFTGWRGIALALFAGLCVLISLDSQIETAMNYGVLAPGTLGRYGGRSIFRRSGFAWSSGASGYRQQRSTGWPP